MTTLPPSIQQRDLTPGYPVLEITHPTCTARVALHGAHLMEWTPAGQKPVLYMSPQAIFEEGKPIRGGVPVCWPWFGANETDASLPAHGFVRIRFWELTESSENSSGVTLKFALQDNEETRKLWPHAFRAELEMRLGAAMHLALRMINPGTTPFEITGALHTYLTVGDIHRVTVEGLDGTEYLDTVGGRRDMHTQVGDVKFDREVDRNYHTSGEVRVQDAAWNRTITVQPFGSHTAVVWNPWIEKSKKLADLPDDAYQGFVCVETANAWRDRVIVAPGAEHTLATTVRVA
jgi:glucose-6-phosphate 1-epimerase